MRHEARCGDLFASCMVIKAARRSLVCMLSPVALQPAGQGLLDAAAAADMLAWENSGFSVDDSARITSIDRDVPSYF